MENAVYAIEIRLNLLKISDVRIDKLSGRIDIFFFPVERLSIIITLWPCFINSSLKFEPINPAPPVTKYVFIIINSFYVNL